MENILEITYTYTNIQPFIAQQRVYLVFVTPIILNRMEH